MSNISNLFNEGASEQLGYLPNWELTNNCIDWCKEQHFSNDFQGIWILFIAAAALLIYYILPSMLDMAEDQVPQDTKDFIMNNRNGLVIFAMLLLFGFFIWFTWFR